MPLTRPYLPAVHGAHPPTPPPPAQLELDAERALRRETQHEAMRHRAALEQTQVKRVADHAFFRDMLKRQRRCIDTLLSQAETPANKLVSEAREADGGGP